MSAIGAFGKNTEAQSSERKTGLLGNILKFEGLLGCVAAERRLDKSFPWCLWRQHAR
jgi:hypothetical protein